MLRPPLLSQRHAWEVFLLLLLPLSLQDFNGFGFSIPSSALQFNSTCDKKLLMFCSHGAASVSVTCLGGDVQLAAWWMLKIPRRFEESPLRAANLTPFLPPGPNSKRALHRWCVHAVGSITNGIGSE